MRDILIHNHLHFSTPASFNDPFDPRPIFTAGDERAFVEHYRKKAVENGLEWDEKSNAREIMAKITTKYQADFKANFRILSLAGTRDSILLWSHYASNHTGVCVHLDRSVVPFPAAVEVRYTDDYPILTFPLADDYTEQFVRTFCTKAQSWCYEHEYRLVLFPESYGHQTRLLWSDWDGARMRLRPEAISGITLGARMGERERREVILMAAARTPVPRIWQAELHDSEFALTFSELHP